MLKNNVIEAAAVVLQKSTSQLVELSKPLLQEFEKLPRSNTFVRSTHGPVWFFDTLIGEDQELITDIKRSIPLCVWAYYTKEVDTSWVPTHYAHLLYVGGYVCAIAQMPSGVIRVVIDNR